MSLIFGCIFIFNAYVRRHFLHLPFHFRVPFLQTHGGETRFNASNCQIDPPALGATSDDGAAKVGDAAERAITAGNCDSAGVPEWPPPHDQSIKTINGALGEQLS